MLYILYINNLRLYVQKQISGVNDNKIPQCCWSHRMFEKSLAVCGRLVWLYDETKLVNDKQIENK